MPPPFSAVAQRAFPIAPPKIQVYPFRQGKPYFLKFTKNEGKKQAKRQRNLPETNPPIQSNGKISKPGI